jgi:hypothetical protein
MNADAFFEKQMGLAHRYYRMEVKRCYSIFVLYFLAEKEGSRCVGKDFRYKGKIVRVPAKFLLPCFAPVNCDPDTIVCFDTNQCSYC